MLLAGGSDARYVSTGHLVYARNDGLFAVRLDLDALAVARPRLRRAGCPSVDSGASRPLRITDCLPMARWYLCRAVLAREQASPLAWVDRHGNAEPITTIRPNIFAHATIING